VQALIKPVGPDDLIGADGRCAGQGPDPAATVASADGEAAATDAGTGAPLTAQNLSTPGAPSVVGGVGLGMSECEVVRRAGTPEDINVGEEQSERAVVLTYMRGTWPGIYRFKAGRLVSIERVIVPEPEKPKKPAKPAKKPAQPAKPKLRPAQAS
jgi:hypothetical protein